MQIKTVEKNIYFYVSEWLDTISDDSLRKEVRENLLVSGGCITSLLLNEQVNDYDIYLMDMDVCLRLAKYYTSQFSDIEVWDGREKERIVGEAGPIVTDYLYRIDKRSVALRNLKSNQIKLYFTGFGGGGLRVNGLLKSDEQKYVPQYFSPNAISLSDNIQIVLRFVGTPEEIHKTFDYIHATNYFTFKQGLVRNLAAIESILTKQLKYQGSYYPVTSIIRAKKFIKRGFNITAGELLKIMFQISQLDLTNPDVLEEQLIGVDVAYFDLLISALRGRTNSGDEFKLTSEYLNELIDKIFNEVEAGDSV